MRLKAVVVRLGGSIEIRFAEPLRIRQEGVLLVDVLEGIVEIAEECREPQETPEGRKTGRRPGRLPDELLERVQELRREGWTSGEVAAEMGLPLSKVNANWRAEPRSYQQGAIA